MNSDRLYVVTPTGDRPEALKLCVKYMNRQTVKPHLWIIVDDGGTASAASLESEISVPHLIIRETPMSTHSLCRNLCTAFSHIPDDAMVCIVEDDDWYPARYLEVVCGLLADHPFVLTRDFLQYNVATRQFKTLKNSDNGTMTALHGNGFSGGGLAAFRDLVNSIDSYKIDSVFCRSWDGDRAFNEDAPPVHITGFGGGRRGTTPSHRLRDGAAGWTADRNGEKLAEWIGDDVRGYLRDEAKIYIFSNVDYPIERKLQVRDDDMLVFLNKASSLDYYSGHPNRYVYRRKPSESYGIERLGAYNRYVYDAGMLSIPAKHLNSLRRTYDWNYPIDKGSVRSPTTGFMVATYLRSAYPTRDVVLVNFGYEVKKSTYRCPWHNWMYEDRVLSTFTHVYTSDREEGVSPEVAKSRRYQFAPVSERALSEIFVEEGCDQTMRHDYGHVYDQQFGRLRSRFARVALLSTSSLSLARATHRVLPHCQVYGVGPREDKPTEGVTVVSGDCYSGATWANVPSDISLIVDDGSHRVDDMLRGIPVFLEHLEPGGVLMIEDVPDEATVTAVMAALPGAECIRTIPVSTHNDDRIIVYKKPGSVQMDIAPSFIPEDRDKSDFELAVTAAFVSSRSDRTTRHDYGGVYAKYLEPMRDRHAKVVEVGVANGSGLLAMRKILPQAKVYGISLGHSVVSVNGATITHGDGYSDAAWSGLPDDFDLIIDDGSHNPEDMFRGVPVFLSHLKPGGVLLIEDIPDEATVSGLLSILDGAVCYHTTPRSAYNDDRIVVYTRPAGP